MMNTPEKDRKRVLVIAYYWPPGGGGGVQRWLKFVKYLPDYGVDPVVAVPDNPEYPILDNSLLSDVSEDLEVIKIPIWEPYKLFKLFTGKKKEKEVNSGLLSKSKKKSLTEKISIWIRGNILIPDPRVFWVRPARKMLLKYLKDSDIDTIITTGPPHSVHLIGLGLKRKLNIKWLADFRDPWSEIDYLEEFKLGYLAKRLQKKLERNVLTEADKIISVSKNWANDYKRLGAKNVSVITNGYDHEDFSEFNYNRNLKEFTLLYSGIMHDYRNPEYLWNALEELCKTSESFSGLFRLKLFGTIDSSITDYIKALPFLSKRFHYGGYIPHDQLLKEYEKASMLLLLQNDTKNALGHIPGKVFEYMATGKLILGIGSPKGDVSKIIEELQIGVMIHKTEVKDTVGKVILDYFESQQVYKESLEKIKKIKAYSRFELTKKLVDNI